MDYLEEYFRFKRFYEEAVTEVFGVGVTAHGDDFYFGNEISHEANDSISVDVRHAHVCNEESNTVAMPRGLLNRVGCGRRDDRVITSCRKGRADDRA